MSNAHNQRRPKATLRPAGLSQPYALKPVFPRSPDVFFEGPRSYFSDDSSDISSSPLSSPSPSPAQVVKANRALKAAPTIVQLQAILPQAPPPVDVRSPTPSDVSWRTATPAPISESASESESEPEPTASTSQIPEPVSYHDGEGGPVKALAGTGTRTGALVMAAGRAARIRRRYSPYPVASNQVSSQKPTRKETEVETKVETKAETKVGARHDKVRKSFSKKATNENEPPAGAASGSGNAAVRRCKPIPLPLACIQALITRRKGGKSAK